MRLRVSSCITRFGTCALPRSTTRLRRWFRPGPSCQQYLWRYDHIGVPTAFESWNALRFY